MKRRNPSNRSEQGLSDLHKCGLSRKNNCLSKKETCPTNRPVSLMDRVLTKSCASDSTFPVRTVSGILQIRSLKKHWNLSHWIKGLVFLLVMTIVLVQMGPLFDGQAVVQAETAINLGGTVNGVSVRVRSEPDTSKPNILATLNTGDRVQVLAQVTGQATSYGDQWYRLEHTRADGSKVTGFIVTALVVLDNEFKGFPESYWPSLSLLQEKYPTWKFTPMNIKFNWERILDEQSKTGRSLIQASNSNFAQRSYAADAYDYATDTWKIHDGTTWVMANRQTIGYYMDPRNWLSENHIFMFENLKYNPNVHNRSGVASILANSFMADGLETFSYQKLDANYSVVRDSNGNPVMESKTHVDAFMEAATRTGVSPYHLAARSRHEIGATKSESVTGTFVDPFGTLDLTGLYNYYNIGANQQAGSSINVRHGLEYALYGPGRKPEQTATDDRYLIPWNNPWKSIVGGAIFIGSSYINHNQHTVYLQKFDLDHDPIYGSFWHQYMGDLLAPRKDGNAIYNAYKSMNQLNNSFEFIIPVIPGLPQTQIPLPTDARSRNHWLKTMTVDGLTLSPAFDPAKTTYSTTVNHDIASATINGTTVNAKASIVGAGTYNLAVGNNIIKLTVTAESGEKREYIVTIARKAADGSLPPDTTTPQNPIPSLTFSQQTLKVSGNTITGVNPAQSLNQVSSFVSNLGVPAGYQVQVLDASGNTQQNLIGTGNTVQVFYGSELIQTYTVVMYGDTNGDGRISSADLNQAFNHVLRKSTLTGVYASAVDVDKNGRASSADLNQIFNHILRKSAIVQ